MVGAQTAEKLWDMANYLTGFAAAQALATTFALSKRELKALHGPVDHLVALVSTVIFTIGYIGAVSWCRSNAPVSDAQGAFLWQRVTLGRIIAILLFNFFVLLALYGHWRFVKSEKQKE